MADDKYAKEFELKSVFEGKVVLTVSVDAVGAGVAVLKATARYPNGGIEDLPPMNVAEGDSVSLTMTLQAFLKGSGGNA